MYTVSFILLALMTRYQVILSRALYGNEIIWNSIDVYTNCGEQTSNTICITKDTPKVVITAKFIAVARNHRKNDKMVKCQILMMVLDHPMEIFNPPNKLCVNNFEPIELASTENAGFQNSFKDTATKKLQDLFLSNVMKKLSCFPSYIKADESKFEFGFGAISNINPLKCDTTTIGRDRQEIQDRDLNITWFKVIGCEEPHCYFRQSQPSDEDAEDTGLGWLHVLAFVLFILQDALLIFFILNWVWHGSDTNNV